LVRVAGLARPEVERCAVDRVDVVAVVKARCPTGDGQALVGRVVEAMGEVSMGASEAQEEDLLRVAAGATIVHEQRGGRVSAIVKGKAAVEVDQAAGQKSVQSSRGHTDSCPEGRWPRCRRVG
jgi:hypothetical protein